MPTNEGFNHFQASNAELIQLCNVSPIVGGSAHGNRVIRTPDNAAIKFGMGVRREEANNQRYVYQHVDRSILRVPEVFRFFEDSTRGSTIGFIVMEYIEGSNLDTTDSIQPNIIPRILKALAHLADIPSPPGQAPGPVGGGIAYGYLWSDYGAQTPFNSIADVEDWLNRRLAVLGREPLELGHNKLVMCHMDLVRRNVIIIEDSSVCLIDWAFAGFYPRLFEICYLRDLLPLDYTWFGGLLGGLDKPTLEQEQILSLLMLPAIISQSCS